MEKITTTIKQFIEKVKPKLTLIDQKVDTFLPNPKIKKIAYIAIGSLFGFMGLIILLGLLLSPFKNKRENNSLILNKPKIIIDSPKPEVVLSQTQKEILKLETEIKELKFPESILNIPQIERELTI